MEIFPSGGFDRPVVWVFLKEDGSFDFQSAELTKLMASRKWWWFR